MFGYSDVTPMAQETPHKNIFGTRSSTIAVIFIKLLQYAIRARGTGTRPIKSRNLCQFSLKKFGSRTKEIKLIKLMTYIGCDF